MKQVHFLMDGTEDIIRGMFTLLQNNGKCFWCGQPINVDFDGDALAPAWQCTNYGCSNSIDYQPCIAWQNALMELMGTYMDIVLCHCDDPVPGIRIEIPCPDCTHDESCDTCKGEFQVFLAFIPKEIRR